MKIIAFVLIGIFVHDASLAKIINGYRAKIDERKKNLETLRLRLLEDTKLSMERRRILKSEIKNLEDIAAFSELTDRVLSQLRDISPSIYQQCDNLQDFLGRETDIHVRLIPRESILNNLRGASFVTQADDDAHANVSTYGLYSVAVDIWISENSLLLLSHELGHVQYIVPNLASYVRFYKTRYTKESINLTCLGHCPNDLSGIMSQHFVRQFIRDRRHYCKASGGKPTRVNTLLARIKEDLKNNTSQVVSPAVASNQ